jgi:tryptophan halogenase
MAHDKAFPRRKDGQPHVHDSHAFHIENKKLVGWLETVSRNLGVEVRDATVRVEHGPGGIGALVTDTGERFSADLYVDASGFRSELLGRALGESFLGFEDTLFCDRAVIGGWERKEEPIKPYTLAETMDSGWCWQIEHEFWINRAMFTPRNLSATKRPAANFSQKIQKSRTNRAS